MNMTFYNLIEETNVQDGFAFARSVHVACSEEVPRMAAKDGFNGIFEDLEYSPFVHDLVSETYIGALRTTGFMP